MLPECKYTYIVFVVQFFNVLCPFHSSGSREIEQDAEMMRLQVLGDPNLMRQLELVRLCHPLTLLPRLTDLKPSPNQN